MADGETQHSGRLGKWAALASLAAVLVVGLLALPSQHPSGKSTHSAASSRTLTALHTFIGAVGPTSAAPSDSSPYAQLVPPDAPKVFAKAAYLMNPTTGEVYYSNNALAEVPMASTTKIMTAIVAMTFGKPDQKITIGADAVKEQNGENSVAWLQLNDVLTLHDLLYALMLPSGDDAAVAIADGVAGSETDFVRMMNLEAALLGLDHTHYANVHGLDAKGHYTTVGDLAHIARVAMNFPLFAEIVKTPTYAVKTALHGQYSWQTTNELLSPLHRYKGAIGVKTGHTGGAGYCLVFAATRDGATLIGVLLGEQDLLGEQRFVDATALLNWGFAHERNVSLWFNAIAGKH